MPTTTPQSLTPTIHHNTMSTIQNIQPSAISESKSAKKKKAKAEAAAPTPPAPSESEAAGGRRPSDGATNGADGSYESPYLKELHKYVSYGSKSCKVHSTDLFVLLGIFVTSRRSW